ncbi:hypothetical protein KGA66_07905 [Actinocrinis puniceicyclus]|uniref:Uncharacterized protein n=1 Tax=Actinocrinis puniceicyclus TaxID=977794 RepID=A0A8J8BBB8_9ACTN|nr:hypothetical protein [Actinocrinis puniceicyclus]MBS2962963.1 hypothetical protein [Actinocrinis puniceicyclus]
MCGQSGFGFVEECEADQAFQLCADAFDVLGQDLEIERKAHLASVQRPLLVAE